MELDDGCNPTVGGMSHGRIDPMVGERSIPRARYSSVMIQLPRKRAK